MTLPRLHSLVLALGLAVAGCTSATPSPSATTPGASTPVATTADPSDPTSPAPTASTAPSGSPPGRSATPDPTRDAIAGLEAKVAAGEAGPDDLAQLGLAYLQRVRERGDPADYGRAADAFDQALASDGRHLPALIGRGVLLLAQHRFAAALEAGQAAVAVAPSSAPAHGIVADAYTELGDYDAAVKAVQTMVDLRPDLASYSRVSYQRELHGQVDGAIAAMEQAVGSGRPGNENTEYVRVQLGHLLLLRGDVDAAERVFATSLSLRPDYVHALAGLARVRTAQGRLDEAIEGYRRASELTPVPEFVIALGETLQAAGRADDARQQYEIVRAMQQLFAANGVSVDQELALFEADHGSDPAAAVALARAAHAERPDNIRTAETLAWALHRNGRSEEAWPVMETALRLGTQDPSLLYRGGVIALAAGRAEEGRKLLQAALDRSAALPPLHLEAARAALKSAADSSAAPSAP